MKINKIVWIAIPALVVGLFTFGTVLAHKGAAFTPAAATIAEILANPVHNQVVTLTGEVTQLLDDNDFILTDSTGSIRVDGGPAWYQQLELAVGQTVTVTGEVDLGEEGQGTTPEIDLFSIESGGQTITLRPAGGGPPPWAGGSDRQGSPDTDDADDDDETASTPEAATIADILANPAGYRAVILTGEVTQLLDDNDFILTDSTGSIHVDGGPAWFQQLELAVGQTVTVTGEVDLGEEGQGTTPEIDLFSIESGGQTITIRPAGGGPPPWAGGSNRQGSSDTNDADDDDD